MAATAATTVANAKMAFFMGFSTNCWTGADVSIGSAKLER